MPAMARRGPELFKLAKGLFRLDEVEKLASADIRVREGMIRTSTMTPEQKVAALSVRQLPSYSASISATAQWNSATDPGIRDIFTAGEAKDRYNCFMGSWSTEKDQIIPHLSVCFPESL